MSIYHSVSESLTMHVKYLYRCKPYHLNEDFYSRILLWQGYVCEVCKNDYKTYTKLKYHRKHTHKLQVDIF